MAASKLPSCFSVLAGCPDPGVAGRADVKARALSFPFAVFADSRLLARLSVIFPTVALFLSGIPAPVPQLAFYNRQRVPYARAPGSRDVTPVPCRASTEPTPPEVWD